MHLIYDNKRPLGRIFGYTIAIIICLDLLVTIYRKPPFPRVPDIPAHIPFQKTATWHPDGNFTVYSKKGMVASDSEYCSKLGADILKQGGNAADAAITTCLCIGATDTMYSSGIGGGAFITSKLFGKDAISIDAREMAPGKASADMFSGIEYQTKYGGLASGIPGELMGLWKLYQLHGSKKLEWKELVEPVAKLIDEGWEADVRLAFALQVQKPAFKYFRKDWDFLHKKGNKLVEKGDWIQRKELAKTLRYVAENGAPAFYDPDGYIAQSLSKKAQEWGGVLEAEDFGMYDVVVEKALKLDNFTDNNLTVFTANGASSGMALLSGLHILNSMYGSNHQGGYDELDFEGETHKLIEVMKWMAAARSYLGDVGIYNNNYTAIDERNERYGRLISSSYVEDVVSKIKYNETHSWEYYKPAYEPNDPHGTSSLSVVDKDGNAVVLTTTVNLLFGSCVHDPETGIILNNEMDDFSLHNTKNSFALQPSVYNFIAPYKRPLSSSAQSIVVDSEGNVDMVVGAAGGSKITNAILQSMVRRYYNGENITEIVANPRLHHQLIPETVYLEEPFRDSLVESLSAKGHDVAFIVPMTAMNVITVEKDGLIAGQSDWWRKFGVAVGV